MSKYRAMKAFDQEANREYYWVERTSPEYGWPAVSIPTQPRFLTFKDAQEYARKLNGEQGEQLKLF